jgi:hypothetical protein
MPHVAFSERNRQELSYTEYRSHIDSFESAEVTFHRSGIQDEAFFNKVTGRSSCQEVNGIPLFLNVDDAPELVNIPRSVEIALTQGASTVLNNINISIVPAQAIIEKADEIRLRYPDAVTYIYSEYDDHAPFSEIIELAEYAGVLVHPLIHPTAGTQAGLNFFEAVMNHPDVGPELPMSLTNVIREGTVSTHEVYDDESMVCLRNGGDFSEEEKKQMWELFSQRFQDISDNLPIRIEEDEESTRKLFDNEDYVFSFKVNNDNKIISVAFATDHPYAYPWISEDFIAKANNNLYETTGDDPYVVFVPGFAAYKKDGMSSSREVLSRLLDVVMATGHRTTAFRFECTDVSSLYVPRIVSGILKRSPNVDFKDMKCLGQKKYILLEIKDNLITLGV